jgi:hypothetical protein
VVDDIYEDDEPDIVCYAHVVDTSDVLDFDDGDEPEFVSEANDKAEEHNERVRNRRVTLTRHQVHDDIKDFELLIYHTAQRVLHKAPRNVGIYHYVPGRADLISLTYGLNIPESIIVYSDALRYKFKRIGIHDVLTLSLLMKNQTDVNVMAELKERFNAVGIKGINTSTVKLLREEVHRNNAHEDYNSSRYETMEFEIGIDATMETFPRGNTLLHHVVFSVAINHKKAQAKSMGQ